VRCCDAFSHRQSVRSLSYVRQPAGAYATSPSLGGIPNECL
jgi:hypothetical protein